MNSGVLAASPTAAQQIAEPPAWTPVSPAPLLAARLAAVAALHRRAGEAQLAEERAGEEVPTLPLPQQLAPQLAA